MKLVPENYVPEHAITITLAWEDDLPHIKYDHIAVAFISENNGAIIPFTFATGVSPRWDKSADVKYLQDKGVDLIITGDEEDGCIEYQVRIENE